MAEEVIKRKTANADNARIVVHFALRTIYWLLSLSAGVERRTAPFPVNKI